MNRREVIVVMLGGVAALVSGSTVGLEKSYSEEVLAPPLAPPVKDCGCNLLTTGDLRAYLEEIALPYLKSLPTWRHRCVAESTKIDAINKLAVDLEYRLPITILLRVKATAQDLVEGAYTIEVDHNELRIISNSRNLLAM